MGRRRQTAAPGPALRLSIMADIKLEMEQTRKELTELLRRVPDKVNNGGHGAAVDYKKAAAKAHSLLNSARANLMTLSQARNSLLSFQ